MSQNGQLHFKNFAANGKTICDNIIQFHALKICDTTSNFCGVGIIKPFQKIMKNKNVLENTVSANDHVIKNCEIFIQTVLYNGTSMETYVKTSVQLYYKQKTRNPITAWKVSKYRVFSGPYFPAFGLNTDRYSVSLCIQSECGKMRTRKKFRIWTIFTQWIFL